MEYFEDPKGNTVSKVVRPAHAEGEKDIRSETVRKLAGQVVKDDADPCHDGLSPRCTPPTSKPVEHKVSRALAGSPTKSPSSGLHKPTWKPSSKPNEHRELAKKDVPLTKDDADPCHDGLSPRCTPPTSKPVEHASKQAAALPRTSRKLSSKSKSGKDSRPTMTPRTDKPSDRVV